MMIQGLPVTKQKRRRRSILREFALTTSTHGLPGIARSESIPNRIFWTISTLIFSGVMVYFVSQSIYEYFTYPSQSSLSVVLEWPVPFPAFTFCNFCPLRADRFMGPFLNYTNARNLTGTTNATSFTFEHLAHIQDFLNEKITRNESRDEFYYSLESMLIYCLYNGKVCTPTDFISFESPYYGRCYTFNAKRKNQTDGGIRYSSENARFGLLSLRLYIHSHQYIPFQTDATGIVAYVHDNGQMPEVDLSAFGLGPGQKHTLIFTKKVSYFLSEPYTNCSTKQEPDFQRMIETFADADYEYSQFYCYTLCAQSYIYQHCGCVHPFYWPTKTIIPFGSDQLITPPFCQVANQCYQEAIDRFINTESIWRPTCPHCVGECKVISLSVTPTSMSAPPAWMMSTIKAFVENSSVPLPTNWSSTWSDEIHSNYIGIDLIRGKNFVENLTQNPSIDAVNVIANVGGHSGLWIGISFLSLMEIVEMLYRLARAQVNRIYPS